MNIALIGYGRMGHEIESVAIERGHTIKQVIDVANAGDLNTENFTEIDAAIEFSSPGSAFENITKCLEMKIPVVSGTTGWLKNYGLAADICLKNGTSFIHSSNFSVGVNILFRLNSDLAKIMELYKEYTPEIEEIHHVKKLDAPSGTAISLAESIKENHEGYHGWCPESNKANNCIPVRSVREGTVTGTHTVVWNSEIDSVSLKHEARNRKGFALGAVLAAEHIRFRKGVFTMNDILGF
ncbi:MAG: 4-hydroxy-tetrahydrodipicolinate reductase [Odoribacter sp.]|nr:4-hydroxy-tetrahydrodipicolinate reductase [Odoribacter sp.]